MLLESSSVTALDWHHPRDLSWVLCHAISNMDCMGRSPSLFIVITMAMDSLLSSTVARSMPIFTAHTALGRLVFISSCRLVHVREFWDTQSRLPAAGFRQCSVFAPHTSRPQTLSPFSSVHEGGLQHLGFFGEGHSFQAENNLKMLFSPPCRYHQLCEASWGKPSQGLAA